MTFTIEPRRGSELRSGDVLVFGAGKLQMVSSVARAAGRYSMVKLAEHDYSLLVCDTDLYPVLAQSAIAAA